MRRSMNKKIILIAMLILLASFGWGCGGETVAPLEDDASVDMAAYDFPEEEQTTPGLSNFSTLDLYGEPVDQSIFSDYEITMVNVWGTFCSPCLEEMPELGEIQREYAGKGFNIIGIVADLKQQNGSLDGYQIAKAQTIVGDTKAEYIHLIPSANLETGLMKDVMYIPHTVFVDKEGNIIGSELVGSRSKEEWITIIEEYL